MVAFKQCSTWTPDFLGAIRRGLYLVFQENSHGLHQLRRRRDRIVMKSQIAQKGAVLLAIAAGAVLGQGCAERQAQTAVQTSLTAVAEGVSTVYDVSLEEYPAALARAREEADAWCAPRLPAECPEGFDRVQDTMAPWAALRDTLAPLSASLLVGQSAVDAWVRSGELDGGRWRPFCEALGEGVDRVVELVEACGLTLPEPVTALAEQGHLACTLAGAWVD